MFILSGMGKDHELLEAARNGNITVVEKILNQKTKRSGPLASLRRGPGANVQDSSGYSALHHAALNGHTDIVRLLLAHDASPNLPDTRGSSPLHLAAWAGHQDIVKLFLTHPHRPANPNLQTIDNETPLHCAAQHGHTGALTTLLAHGADPNVLNNRNESPLDLAAQYGRLQVVQMLIRAHPELLLPFKADNPLAAAIVSHSPLHLASRNGHKQIVEVLLTAGVNVNLLTPSGAALHEAALCGKDSVVRTLLDAGADLDATDCEGRTALDILEEFPPHVTKGIVSVINNYRNSMNYDSEPDEVRELHQHHNPSMQQQYQEEEFIQYHRYPHHHYHHHHHHHRSTNNNNNKRKNHSTTPVSLGSSYENNCTSPMQNYCNSQHDVTISPSSSMGSLGPSSPSPRPRNSMVAADVPEFYVNMAPAKPVRSVAPKKPPRRNLPISPTHLQQNQHLLQRAATTVGGGGSSMMTGTCNIGDDDNNSGIIGGQQQQSHHPPVGSYEYICLARTGNRKNDKMNRAYSFGQYVEMAGPPPKPAPRNPISVSYENTTILKSYNPNRKLRRNRENYEHFSVDFNKDRSCNFGNNSDTASSSFSNYNRNTPQSPTNYKQPSTPDHPPPSAIQAEKLIHECIRPLSQEYKWRSGLQQTNNIMMIESGTSPSTTDLHQQFCSTSLCASSGSISSSVSLSDRSVSTDCVEEYVGDVPFAGLFKGSTMTLNYPNVGYQQQQQQQQHHQLQDFYSGSGNHQIQSKSFDPRLRRGLGTFTSRDCSTGIGGLLLQQDHQYFMYRNDEDYYDYRGGVGISQYYDRDFSGDDVSGDDLLHSNAGDEDDDNYSNDYEKKRKENDDGDNGELRTIGNSGNSAGDAGRGEGGGGGSSGLKLTSFNEEEAWAKISEIMESFGSSLLSANEGTSGNMRKSINNCPWSSAINNMSKANTNLQKDEMSYREKFVEFLKELELNHLEEILLSNGFDDLDYMNGIMDVSDLKTMNISEEDSEKLLTAIKNLPLIRESLRSVSFLNSNKDNDGINDGNNKESNFEKGISSINEDSPKGLTKMNSCYNSKSNNDDDDSNIISMSGKNSRLQQNGINNNNNNDNSRHDDETNNINSNNNISVLNMDQWLKDIHLTEYSDIFKKHLHTNIDGICHAWEIELQAVLEINKLGHRKRILYSLSSNNRKQLKSNTVAVAVAVTAEASSENSVIINTADGNDIESEQSRKSHKNTLERIDSKTSTGGEGTASAVAITKPPTGQNDGNNPRVSASSNVSTTGIRHSNKKNRPAPKPPTRIAVSSSLEIRAPSELLLGLPSNLRTQWRHSAATLVTGSVKYDVYYLGSTVVKELRGTESTRKSIQKLKRDDRISFSSVSNLNSPQKLPTNQCNNNNNNNTNNNNINNNVISNNNNNNNNNNINQNHYHSNNKRQPVRLSISHRGVEFIDISNMSTICEHEIRNINCACQDADDLSHFAYITKDADMNTHYCHVFNVDSMDLATEIILTLGQAFEVAYQLALRDFSTTNHQKPFLKNLTDTTENKIMGVGEAGSNGSCNSSRGDITATTSTVATGGFDGGTKLEQSPPLGQQKLQSQQSDIKTGNNKNEKQTTKTKNI